MESSKGALIKTEPGRLSPYELEEGEVNQYAELPFTKYARTSASFLCPSKPLGTARFNAITGSGSVFAPQQTVDQLLRAGSFAAANVTSKAAWAGLVGVPSDAALKAALITGAANEQTSGFFQNLNNTVAVRACSTGSSASASPTVSNGIWDAAKLEDARLARLAQLERLGVGDNEPYNVEQTRDQQVQWTGSNGIPLGESGGAPFGPHSHPTSGASLPAVVHEYEKQASKKKIRPPKGKVEKLHSTKPTSTRKRRAARLAAEELKASGLEHMTKRLASRRALELSHERLTNLDGHIKVLDLERREVLKTLIKQLEEYEGMLDM